MGRNFNFLGIVLYVVLVFNAKFSNGQNQHKIDSIKSLNLIETNKENLAYNYIDISDLFSVANVDSAIIYANKALKVSKEIDFKVGEAEAYYILGYYHDQTGESAAAIEELEMACKLYIEIGDSSYLSGCYNNLGVLYSYGDNQKKSLEYFIKSMILAEELNETFSLSEAYSNIGSYYDYIKEYKYALKYYQKALDIDLEIGYAENIALSYLNLGDVNLKLQRYDSAFNNLTKAQHMVGEIKDMYRQTELNISFAYYYLDTSQPDSVKSYIRLAESIKSTLNYPRLKADILLLKGDYHLGLKEYEECILLYNKASDLYERLNVHEVFYDLYMHKAEAFSELGRHNEAFRMLKLANDKNDSFKPNEIARVLGEFEQDEALKEERIQMNLEQELANEKNRNDIIEIRSNLKFAIFSIVCLLLFMAIVLYFYLAKRKYNAKLELNYKTIDHQKKLLEENLRKLEINEKKLIELNSTKDKFFSIIAHDLKNPFNVLIGLSEVLLRNPDIKHSNDFEQLVDGMFQAATSGYDLLENLLEWARSQTGGIDHNPKPVEINEIIEQNTSLFHELAKAKGISFNSESGSKIKVFADYDMVNCIVRNLISNAIKFSHKNSQINVSVQQENELCIVSIQDFGVGISSDNVNKLFKIENSIQSIGTSNEKGTGLGLILSKEFVDKNGGKIWVDSVEGKGSKFSFSLPLAKK